MSSTSGLEPFLGNFQFEKAENLEAFLKALGQNMVMRKLSLACSPSASLSVETKDGKEVIKAT